MHQNNNDFSNMGGAAIGIDVSDSMRRMGLENFRNSEVKHLPLNSIHAALDKNGSQPNHEAMTDLTRQEVEATLARNKAEVDARLANFDTSIKTGFAELRAEFAELRAELAKQASDTRVEMANVRADTQKSATEITRWVVGFGIAILGAMFTLSKVGDKSPVQPAVQAAPAGVPYVIAVPPGAAILNPPAPASPVAPPASK